jgi:magnesium transporter
VIRVVAFPPDGRAICGGRELLEAADADQAALWIDFEGFHPEYRELLEEWGFHPLAIEDTFTLEHQPKVAEFPDHLFVIARGIDFNRQDGELATLKIAAFLEPRRLVTVHRAPMRSIETIRRRLEETPVAPPGGTTRIFFSISDELIDLFFPVVDEVGDRIEELEETVLGAPTQAHLQTVLNLRRRLATLRRAMLPHRQVFSHLANLRSELIDDVAALHFRDIHDNVLRLADAIDQQRDQLGNLKDTYLSVVAQRTNDIMKALTLLSAVLLPLTFIAGVYGMNFDNMPELHTKVGYFVVLGVMISVALGMVAWFRSRRWL